MNEWNVLGNLQVSVAVVNGRYRIEIDNEKGEVVAVDNAYDFSEVFDIISLRLSTEFEARLDETDNEDEDALAHIFGDVNADLGSLTVVK